MGVLDAYLYPGFVRRVELKYLESVVLSHIKTWVLAWELDVEVL